MTESSFFDDKGKKEISDFIIKSMALVSAESLSRIDDDMQAQIDFIGKALKFRKDSEKLLLKIMGQVHKGWKEYKF